MTSKQISENVGMVLPLGSDVVQAEVFAVCRSLQPTTIVPEGRFPIVVWVHANPIAALSACGLRGIGDWSPQETMVKAGLGNHKANGNFLCPCQLRFIE